MTKPVTLVTPPTSESNIRGNMITMLEEALADAKAGKLRTLVMIFERMDMHWGNDVSGTPDMARAIGQLEIVKHSWIMSYETDSVV